MNYLKMKGNENMQVIIQQPGHYPLITEIENQLEELQSIVDGYIEVIPFIGNKVVCICNEEGKLRNLTQNFAVNHNVICGSAVFAGVDGENFCSLKGDELNSILEYLYYNRII